MAGRGLNKVMIVGNLGRDPELRYTPSGKAVANFTVAVGRITGSGESRTEETEWFRVVAWERLAETCNEYLRKGSKVYIEGRLQSRKYTDKDGVERTSVEIVANDMLMLDSRNAAAESRGGGEEHFAPAGARGGEDDIDDLPF